MIEGNFWGVYSKTIESWIQRVSKQGLVKRLWQKDPTLWKPGAAEQIEIVERLGWLDAPEKMQPLLEEIKAFADPTKGDTDNDGLPDPYELAHPCLNVFVNQALPQDNYGRITPGDDDADDDGVTNFEELTRGTDPCAP